MSRLALLVVLASCGPPQFVRYDLDTEVAKDGTWSRTYTSRGYRNTGNPPHAPEYQRVDAVKCAALPACPPKAGEEPAPELPTCAAEELWPIRAEMVDDRCGAVLERVTFRRSGAANASIGADFERRKTIAEVERIAGNTISVRRIDLGVLVFYEYRETYRQWIEPGDVIEAGRVVLDLVLELALEMMRSELDADYDTTRGEAYLHQVRAELAEIVAIAAFTDIDRDAALNEISRRLKQRGIPLDDQGRPDEKRFGEWFDAHISGLLSPKRKQAPHLAWADLSTEYFQNYLEEKWKKRIETLTKKDQPLSVALETLGAAFEREEFRPRLRLPGQLIDTDGAVGIDGAVSWRLDPDDFEVEPREIRALSMELSKKAAKLYPNADADGPGLVAFAKTASKLSTDDQARLAKLLNDKDIAGLEAWCGESVPLRSLSQRLGLSLECRAREPESPVDRNERDD